MRCCYGTTPAGDPAANQLAFRTYAISMRFSTYAFGTYNILFIIYTNMIDAKIGSKNVTLPHGLLFTIKKYENTLSVIW